MNGDIDKNLASHDRVFTVRPPTMSLSPPNVAQKPANPFHLAPVLDVLNDDYQTWKFNGTFRNKSPYKGPPNAEVDKAWADLLSCTTAIPMK